MLFTGRDWNSSGMYTGCRPSWRSRALQSMSPCRCRSPSGFTKLGESFRSLDRSTTLAKLGASAPSSPSTTAALEKSSLYASSCFAREGVSGIGRRVSEAVSQPARV